MVGASSKPASRSEPQPIRDDQGHAGGVQASGSAGIVIVATSGGSGFSGSGSVSRVYVGNVGPVGRSGVTHPPPGSAGGGPLSSDGNSVGTSPRSLIVTVSVDGGTGHVTSKSIGGISSPAIDELSAVMKALAEEIAELDEAVASGDRDAIEHELGDVLFWRIAMRPGRPMAIGRIRNAILFGLPGNPVSAIVTFMIMVRPFVLRRTKRDPSEPLN